MKKLAFLPLAFFSFPALAHQGDHTGMTMWEIVEHVFETDHIVFAAIAVVTGIVCFRAGRRAEARANGRKDIAK